MIKLLDRVHPMSRGLVCAIDCLEYGGLLSNDAVFGNNLIVDSTGSKLDAKGLTLDGTGFASLSQVYNKYIAGNDFHTFSYEIRANSFANSPMHITTVSDDFFFVESLAFSNQIYWGYKNGIISLRTYTLDKTLDSWHTITVVKTGAGDSGNLYLDGKLQTSYTGTIPSIVSTQDSLQLGRYRAVNTFSLNGSIRNLRIYNRSLNSNEAMQLAINPNCIYSTSNISSLYIARNQNNFFRMFN